MLQQTINGIALGATYALLGLGVTLIWGVLRVMNFAFGQFITWGAFGCLVAIEDRVPIDSQSFQEEGGDDAGPVLAGMAVEHRRQAPLPR